jgi:hypothetical protein
MKVICKKHLGVVALTWAGCFVLFLLAYVFVLGPQNSSKKKIAKKFLEAKQTYDSTVGAAKDEAKVQLSEELQDLQNTLQQFVIDVGDSANLTFDISQIANENRVTSFSINSKDRPESPMAPKYNHIGQRSIHVSFAAGFNQFAGFLNALERNQPVLFVDKLMITRSDQDNAGHQVNMDLAVFVRKQQDS